MDGRKDLAWEIEEWNVWLALVMPPSKVMVGKFIDEAKVEHKEAALGLSTHIFRVEVRCVGDRDNKQESVKHDDVKLDVNILKDDFVNINGGEKQQNAKESDISPRETTEASDVGVYEQMPHLVDASEQAEEDEMEMRPKMSNQQDEKQADDEKEAEALAEARANSEVKTELECRLREAADREATFEEIRETISIQTYKECTTYADGRPTIISHRGRVATSLNIDTQMDDESYTEVQREVNLRRGRVAKSQDLTRE
eukprot:Gb_21472 [translate_table: standard]